MLQVLLPFSNAFCGLFTRWIPEINPKGLGNTPHSAKFTADLQRLYSDPIFPQGAVNFFRFFFFSFFCKSQGPKDNSGCYSEEVVEAGSQSDITQIKSVASIKSHQAAAILALS